MPSESLRYQGSLEGAYDLVDELRAQGIDVEWEPLPEERTNTAREVELILQVIGDEGSLSTAIDQFRHQMQGTEIVREPELPPPRPEGPA